MLITADSGIRAVLQLLSPFRCHSAETELHRQQPDGGKLRLRAGGLRFATLCMWLEAIFRVVTSDKVVYLFGRVSPRLSLFLTILLRFIPRVGREARKINLAQKGIGRGSNQGNVRAFALYVIELLRARRYVRRYKRSARKLATYSNAPALCECATIPLAALLHF